MAWIKDTVFFYLQFSIDINVRKATLFYMITKIAHLLSQISLLLCFNFRRIIVQSVIVYCIHKRMWKTGGTRGQFGAQIRIKSWFYFVILFLFFSFAVCDPYEHSYIEVNRPLSVISNLWYNLRNGVNYGINFRGRGFYRLMC